MEQPTVTASFPSKLKFLFQPSRYKVAYGGRGAAKSWGFARALLLQGVREPLRVLCAREVQRTISDSVHRLLSDQIAALGLSHIYRITDNDITAPNGTSFSFAGLRQQDAGKLKSYEGVDICWVEEAQTVSKRSWDVLTPTIRRESSEIWISFNPDLDTDETYRRFVISPPPDCVSVKINYTDNPWFPEVLRKEMEHCRHTDPVAWENVWNGNCRAAVEGAIYLNELSRCEQSARIREVPYDPKLKVHTVWDLGWNDKMTIILAQRSASEIRIIDYIEDHHRRLDQYAEQLKALPITNWGVHWLPHDGATADMKTGMTSQQILRPLLGDVRVIPRLSIEDGIRQARLIFDRCYFDTKTVRLRECLKRYRRAINVATNEAGAPLHDEFSHGADAFRYLAVVVDQMGNEDYGPKLKYPNMRLV